MDPLRLCCFKGGPQQGRAGRGGCCPELQPSSAECSGKWPLPPEAGLNSHPPVACPPLLSFLVDLNGCVLFICFLCFRFDFSLFFFFHCNILLNFFFLHSLFQNRNRPHSLPFPAWFLPSSPPKPASMARLLPSPFRLCPPLPLLASSENLPLQYPQNARWPSEHPDAHLSPPLMALGATAEVTWASETAGQTREKDQCVYLFPL